MYTYRSFTVITACIKYITGIGEAPANARHFLFPPMMPIREGSPEMVYADEFPQHPLQFEEHLEINQLVELNELLEIHEFEVEKLPIEYCDEEELRNSTQANSQCGEYAENVVIVEDNSSADNTMASAMADDKKEADDGHTEDDCNAVRCDQAEDKNNAVPNHCEIQVNGSGIEPSQYVATDTAAFNNNTYAMNIHIPLQQEPALAENTANVTSIDCANSSSNMMAHQFDHLTTADVEFDHLTTADVEQENSSSHSTASTPTTVRSRAHSESGTLSEGLPMVNRISVLTEVSGSDDSSSSSSSETQNSYVCINEESGLKIDFETQVSPEKKHLNYNYVPKYRLGPAPFRPSVDLTVESVTFDPTTKENNSKEASEHCHELGLKSTDSDWHSLDIASADLCEVETLSDGGSESTLVEEHRSRASAVSKVSFLLQCAVSAV